MLQGGYVLLSSRSSSSSFFLCSLGLSSGHNTPPERVDLLPAMRGKEKENQLQDSLESQLSYLRPILPPPFLFLLLLSESSLCLRCARVRARKGFNPCGLGDCPRDPRVGCSVDACLRSRVKFACNSVLFHLVFSLTCVCGVFLLSMLGCGVQTPPSTSAGSGLSKSQSSFNDRSKKKRLIVFILGGITHAEMRSAYEVSKNLNADVILGTLSSSLPASLPFSARLSSSSSSSISFSLLRELTRRARSCRSTTLGELNALSLLSLSFSHTTFYCALYLPRHAKSLISLYGSNYQSLSTYLSVSLCQSICPCTCVEVRVWFEGRGSWMERRR